MAGTIRVLWIEDNDDEAIEELKDIVREEVKDRLYKCEIIPVKSIDEAEIKMEENYIDIICSDFNLGEREKDGKIVTGLDYLTELRGAKNYKYYVLYSGNSQRDIVNEVTEKIKEKNKMNLFSNFNFFSRADYPEDELDEIIQHYLDERSKIEELRNIYIIKNALMDEEIKKILGAEGKDYCERIDKYCLNNEIDSNTKNLWHDIRILRNAFAHGKQKFKKNEWTIEFKNIAPIQINDGNYKDYLEKISDLEKVINIL